MVPLSPQASICKSFMLVSLCVFSLFFWIECSSLLSASHFLVVTCRALFILSHFRFVRVPHSLVCDFSFIADKHEIEAPLSDISAGLQPLELSDKKVGERHDAVDRAMGLDPWCSFVQIRFVMKISRRRFFYMKIRNLCLVSSRGLLESLKEWSMLVLFMGLENLN